MAVISGGDLTTADPHYYNAALDTTGGYIEIADGQLAFVDVYMSAKGFIAYGIANPTGTDQAVHPAGALVTYPRDPGILPGTTWQLFVKAAAGTLEVSATGHNNGGFRTG